MKSNKKALIILLGCLSTSHLANARGFLKASLRKSDESFERVTANTVTSALMDKMSGIFVSCKDCESSSPSPHLVSPDEGIPSPSSSTPGSSASSSSGQGSMQPTTGGIFHIQTGKRIIEKGDYFVGCFEKETGGRLKDVSDASDMVEACNEYCGASSYFSILDINGAETCNCYSDVPKTQLSINHCKYTDSEVSEKMDLWVNIGVNDVCGQPETKAYRNKLVQENKLLGFNHVSNKHKLSPFQHFNIGCSTNMYDLETAYSGNSKSVTTSSSTMTDFASEKSSKLTDSISSRLTLGKTLPLYSLSAELSAKADSEISSFVKSTGAESANSMLFYSFGVQRIVKIRQNYRDKSHFVLFNDDFINALKRYKDRNFDFTEAKKIFESYGTTVLESGYVGGYIKKSSTMQSSVISTSFDSVDEAKNCYTALMKLEAKYGGIGGGFTVDDTSCSEEKLEVMKKTRETFKEETSEDSWIGGRIDPTSENFEVNAATAALLTLSDMYPVVKGEKEKLSLRFLTDYLKEDKISPLEYSWWQISSSEFQVIRVKLEEHLEEYLRQMGVYLDKCKPCPGNLYLKQVGNTDPPTYECDCYFHTVPEKDLTPTPNSLVDGAGFGKSCDISQGVMVVGSLNQATAYYYVDGILKKQLTSQNEKKGLFGREVVIDKYIAIKGYDTTEIYDKSGKYLRTLDKFLFYLATAGDLVAGFSSVTASDNTHTYPLNVYKASTGECLHSLEGFERPRTVKMTTKYLVVSVDHELNVYSIENGLQKVGKIPVPLPERFNHFDIFDDKIAYVGRDSEDVETSKPIAGIYSTAGSLIVELQIPDNSDNLNYYLGYGEGDNVSIDSRFVVVGCRYVGDESASAVYVFDAETGKFLEKRISLNPKPYEGYGYCVAISGDFMVVTGYDEGHVSKEFDNRKGSGYFQTILKSSNDNFKYANTTSGIKDTEDIIITEY